MKKLIDAVNEFEGDMGCYNYIFVGTNKNKLNRGVSQLTLSTINNDSWWELCGRHEFLATVAECEANFGECITYAEYKTEYARKEKVIIMLDELHKLIDDPVKELDVLINCTSNNDQQPAQVFTQAMADNGEFPSAGMECELVIFENLTSLGHIEFKNEVGFLFRYKENNLCDFMEFSSDVVFKPLTQSIELIDGKAYQFTNIEDNTIHGIYDEDEHSFRGTCVEWVANSCTNIRPLTVEVK